MNKNGTSSPLYEVSFPDSYQISTCVPARAVILTHAKYGIYFTLKRQIPFVVWKRSYKLWMCRRGCADIQMPLKGVLSQLGLSSCCRPLSHQSAPWPFTFAIQPRRMGGETSLRIERAYSELMLCAYQAKANCSDAGMCRAKGSSKCTMRDCSLMPFGWEIMRFSPSLPLGFSYA